jgi:siroheme synthase
MAAQYAAKALLYDQLVGQEIVELADALKKTFVCQTGMLNTPRKHIDELLEQLCLKE